uniref:Putative ovule protein n=1 Tax=Solanum chacoense TaxID=4108 RepID=A0A0V0H066_SOLCH
MTLDIFAGSYLMKVVLITNTMNINLVKRKRLYHRPVKPKHHIVSKIYPHAYIAGTSLISFLVT